MKKVLLSLLLLAFQHSAFSQNCLQPFNLSSSNITNTAVDLSWDPSVTADSFMIRYYYDDTTTYKWKTLSGAGGVSSYTLTGLLPGETYFWQIRSYCTAAANLGYPPVETFSTQATSVACSRPFNLDVSSITNNSVLAEWSPLITADTFRIRYSVDGTTNYLYKDINAQAGGISSATLSNLTIATTYQFQVSSICSGVSSGYSSSFVFSTASIPVPCIKPYNTTASPVTNSTAKINWTNLVTADTFRIRYSLDGTTNYLYKDFNGSGGTTSGTITGLVAGTDYQFQVSSVCNGVGTGYSPSVVFTTTSTAVFCGTPYDLTTPAVTGTTATLNWTPLVTADSFLVRYAVQGTTNYVWKQIPGAGGVTSTTLAGLQLSTTYDWQVRTMCNGQPITGYSAVASFTTDPFRMRNPNSLTYHFEIFPNPANENISLRFNSTENGKASVHLFDFTGRSVLSREIKISDGENLIPISLTGLAKGVYSLRYESDETSESRTIIKE